MKKIYFVYLVTVFNLFFNAASFAQWQRVKSFTGGSTSCMAKDGNTIYGFIDFYGLVKSTDGGNHWDFVNDSITLAYNWGTSISAEGSRIVVNRTNNIFQYSVDSGLTFQNLTVGYSEQDIKLYKGNIIATERSGYKEIHVSNDDGLTWTTDTLNEMHRIEISDGKIFLVPSPGGGALYTSYDSCQTWVNIGNSPVGMAWDYPSFSAKGDTLALIAYYSLYLSTDFGTSWNFIPMPITSYYSNPVVYLDNDTLFLAVNDTIFSSLDLGATWNARAYFTGLSPTSIIKNGNNLLMSSRHHAFVQFDQSNNSTRKKARGIYGIEIYDMKLKGDTILIKADPLIYYSYDNGRSWDYSIPVKGSKYWTLDFDTGAIYVTTSNNGYMYRSLDWAKTWSIYDSIPNINTVYQILYHNGKLYYAAGSTVFKGNNLGGPIKKYGDVPGNGVIGIAICKNKLFAIGNSNIYATDLVTNPQWNSINYGIANTTDFDWIVASDSAFYLGGFNKCVYRCYPSDTIWENVGLCQKWMSDLDCFHNDAFSTSGGKGIAIQQNSQGIAWVPFNDGLHDYSPTQFAIGDSSMYCGGYRFSCGLFRRSLTDLPAPLSINETEDENDLYFSMYPNPVSDNLQISGYIQSSHAEINLIDVTGRICFHKNIFAKGDFTVNINVNDFSDGIYILILTDGSKKFSEKILIRK